jgi:hypothetical protein
MFLKRSIVAGRGGLVGCLDPWRLILRPLGGMTLYRLVRLMGWIDFAAFFSKELETVGKLVFGTIGGWVYNR